MKPSRIRARAALAASATAALAAVTLAPQSAGAQGAAAPRQLTAVSAGQLARTLLGRLKGQDAGAYYDEGSHRLVVDVVDRAAESVVRAAGAEPRLVTYSQAELDSTKAALDATPAIPGTTWGPDPRTNRVVVTADPTVTGTKLARLKKTVGSFGDTVLMRRTATKLTRFIAGGDAIWGRDFSARCSVGFNVKRPGKPDGFLTAGHCGNVIKSWAEKQGGPETAKTVDSKFPGTDFSLAEYTATVGHPSAVNLYNGQSLTVNGARDAVVGDKVGRSGSTTNVHYGTVTAVNQTVNYQEGQVTGLVKTDVCAQPGDSGGAFFAYDPQKPTASAPALGITSGGDGDCMMGGTTFFQPVVAALNAYGASVGGG
ncbi:S1 family peptidase [Streptomyces sp. NPDC020379]|uniref:S1 family peptidase n=1 Tax=Streptomyces sp. NPDC020379 TaxID=3365071 RepID=UPI0037AA39A0